MDAKEMKMMLEPGTSCGKSEPEARMTNFDMVGEVYAKFGLPVWGERPAGILRDDEFLMRYDLMAEELHEVLKAHRARDLEKMADGLADLLFVVYGTAHACGIPIDHVFSEVTRANFAKERASGDADPRSARRSGLDLVKPDGWQPPDVAGAIAAARRRNP